MVWTRNELIRAEIEMVLQLPLWEPHITPFRLVRARLGLIGAPARFVALQISPLGGRLAVTVRVRVRVRVRERVRVRVRVRVRALQPNSAKQHGMGISGQLSSCSASN